MRLLLIRHGESRHSVEGTAAGLLSCTGLSGSGRHQAERLRDRFTGEGFMGDVLLSSPVARALQTADILRPVLRPGGHVSTDCDLCEMHLGEGDGLPVRTFHARYGSFDPQEHPDRCLSPGGDSWNSFSLRVETTLQRLAEAHPDDDVVLVTHAGFIVRVFLHLLAVAPAASNRAWLSPDFASLTEWHWMQSPQRWALAGFNDTAHLTAPGLHGPGGARN